VATGFKLTTSSNKSWAKVRRSLLSRGGAAPRHPARVAGQRRAVARASARRTSGFLWLLLPAFNRAVFWFSPLAWWQLVRMAELAEIISDDTVLEKLDDRPSYAGILIDLASGRQEALVGSFALRVESRLRSSQSIQVYKCCGTWIGTHTFCNTCLGVNIGRDEPYALVESMIFLVLVRWSATLTNLQ
jgi:hypothetical protein